MSGKAIKNWLDKHRGEIPANDDCHRQVSKLVNQGVASLGDVADAMMLDPGMAVALLRRVNSRLRKSRRAGVDNLHSAASLLGKPAVATLVSQQKSFSTVAASSNSAQHYRQILNQNFHALMQLDMLTRIQGISTVEDMRTSVLLYSIGELYASLLDPQNYSRYRQQFDVIGSKEKAATEAFGFNFRALSRTLAYDWNLPDLLTESLDDGDSIGRKARLIQYAAEIAGFAESGWYHRPMISWQQQCADFHNINSGVMTRNIHQTAIQAARQSPYSDVIHAAARLILLPDVKPVTRPKQAIKPVIAKKTEKAIPLPEQIKDLLKNPDANQSSVLSLLINGLQKEAGFSCIALMLLTGDRKKLQTRTGKGLDTNPAFGKLALDVTQAGLIKALLQKPQALLINNSNYRKYETMLPGPFKAASMCDNFVMMSVFIGSKPIGLVYCDRQKIERPIDAAGYNLFKSSVMMTSKALAYLVKRNAKSAA